MAFKIVLSDNSLIKESFEAITAIVDEVICIVDSEGFRVSALDRSHIAFVNLDLKPTAFDEFECETPEKIAVDTQEVNQILKRMKKTDMLNLSCDEGNFIISLKGDVDREFKIRLIDVEYEAPQPPALIYNSRIEVPSALVKDCITDMELFSDKLYFLFDQDYFRVKSDGEFGDADIAYIHGEDIDEVVKSCYSIPKLKEIFKASKFSEYVEICLGNDMPVTFNFKLVSDDGNLGFLLAPRLEEEE